MPSRGNRHSIHADLPQTRGGLVVACSRISPTVGEDAASAPVHLIVGGRSLDLDPAGVTTVPAASSRS